ncbi:MAG TPA: phage recombination protein Bet [Solimonas sp.]
MGDNGSGLTETLKATAFKGQVSDAQMTALLIVANQYALNPWTKEIYAFPDKNNGIVPVVGVDGWARIINSHQQFDGMTYRQDAESCTCIIYRKDRAHPTEVTEFMSECKRGTQPWQSHPRRMLRHKATIQCARLAFGFGGIYDQDEAERIVESRVIDVAPAGKPDPKAVEFYPQEQFETNLKSWRTVIELKRMTAENVIARAEAKHPLTDEQKEEIRKLEPIAEPQTDSQENSDA